MSTAKKLKYGNLLFTVVWVILVVPSWLWWKNSILWVIFISLWANIGTHFSAYIAARAELAQQTGHNLTELDRQWLRELLKGGNDDES